MRLGGCGHQAHTVPLQKRGLAALSDPKFMQRLHSHVITDEGKQYLKSHSSANNKGLPLWEALVIGVAISSFSFYSRLRYGTHNATRQANITGHSQ